jgi:hypothetical protein
MSANQLGTLKTATLNAFNDALNAIDGANGADIDSYTQDMGGTRVNKKLLEALETQRKQFNTEKSMAGQRTAMNPAVRKMLGIKDILN